MTQTMLNRDEKIAILTKLISAHKKADAAIEEVKETLGISVTCESSELFGAVWGAIDTGVETVSALVGDEGEWLNWYIYENEYGAKKLKAGYNGKLKKVCSVNDLFKLIEEGQKQ
jgi:hypothetical protein